MKRFAAMLMSLLLCVSMSACSAPAQDDDAGTAEPSTTENTQDTGGQNVLVVYYSATGNTESVANGIAAALDADVFELEPVDPYTEEDLNWTDDNSRVVAEYEMKTSVMWNWSARASTTGKRSIPCSSDIRSGGALPHGR